MTKRLVVSVLAWLSCYPALMLSMGMAVGSALDFNLRWHGVHPQGPTGQGVGELANAAALAGLALGVPSAWTLLAGMTIAWIRDRRLRPWCPRVGTGAGLLSFASIAAQLGPFGMWLAVGYSLPGLLLAGFLCRFHWRGPLDRRRQHDPVCTGR